MQNNFKNGKVNIGGLFFDNLTMEECIIKIENEIKKNKNKKTKLVALSNQDTISRINNAGILNKDSMNKNSFLILPDGYSIIAASKILGAPLKERIAGPDLMDKLMSVSADKGYTNFLLGAKEDVSKKLAANLLKKFPKLKIVGRYSPPFGNFTKNENDKMIKLINKSKADFLWVSFGCPKQEKWIIDHTDKINVPLSFGIGAAFDFLSGNLKRAPLIIQNLKLEWFHRLINEPGRLWKRYFIGGIIFLWIILKQKYFQKKIFK